MRVERPGGPSLLFPQPGDRTRIIGHRGLPGRLPENTVASLTAAAEAGADLVEVDVRTTRDGVLVLMHDAAVDRTTDGTGVVRDMDLAAVRRLSAGGEPVPTLVEAMAAVPCPFMVDYDELAEAEGLSALLADPGLRRRVLITGGNVAGHAALRRAYPDLAIALSIGGPPMDEAYWNAAWQIGVQYANPHHAWVRPRMLRRARAMGLGVSTWTVDGAVAMRRLLRLGVDAIISNRTDLAVAARRAHEEAGAHVDRAERRD